MNSKSKKALALMVIGGGLAGAVPATTAFASCGACKPKAACSACAGAKCGACAAKKCGACAAKKCGACAAKKD